MGTTRKALKKAAFRLEAGLDDEGSAPHDGWGDADAIQDLGANHALSVTEFNASGTSETEQDESMEGVAAQDLPNQVEISAKGSMGGNLRYEGMDKILYWALGYEDGGESPVTACQFTVSGVSSSPSADDTYTNNSSTFTVTGVDITDGAGTIYTSRTAGSNAPESSGDLTRTAGSGDETIAFSATTGIYYSHGFELDMRDRHYAAYRGSPDEQTADDYNAGDRKNRMATIGVLLGPNDHQFPNAMCMRITISGEAGQASKWSTEWVAYDENRGDYSSATWTYPSGHSGSSLNVLHHHWDIGVYGGASWADLNVRRFNISIEIPLDLVQDSESGLYLAEPMGSGKYNISGSLSLTRHSADTFHGYRDAYTDLALRFIATLASRQIKILVHDVRFPKVSVGQDDVPPVEIEWVCGWDGVGSTPIDYDLEGHTVLQESPLMIITNNTNTTNEMRRE